MTKLILGIVIVAFTSFCGSLLAKKYKKRRDFLIQLSEFNDRFLNEVNYYKRPLKEFFAEYQYKDEFGDFLLNYTAKLGTQNGEIEVDDYDFLMDEDKRIVQNYFSMLGKGDTASQKTYYGGMKEIVKSTYLDAENTYKKYGNLYVKIGFLCGLLFLILII